MKPKNFTIVAYDILKYMFSRTQSTNPTLFLILDLTVGWGGGVIRVPLKKFSNFFGTPAGLVPLYEKMTHKNFQLDQSIITRPSRSFFEKSKQWARAPCYSTT